MLQTNIENFDEPRDFTYGGDPDNDDDEGHVIKFSAGKKTFVDNFVKATAEKAHARISERFPDDQTLLHCQMDIFDRRQMAVELGTLTLEEHDDPDNEEKRYGTVALRALFKYFDELLHCNAAQLLEQWCDFVVELERRPCDESYQLTYSHFKSKWKTAAGGCPYPDLEVLMDVKAVWVFASVCCERGFSALKEAKGERQSAMMEDTLDYRLRIQLNGPQDPRKIWTTTQKADQHGFRRARENYNKEVKGLITRAMQRWGPEKHLSAAAIQKSQNAQGGLGVARKRKPRGGGQSNRYDISAFDFLAGNFEEGKCNPTLKPKFGTTLAEQDEVSGIDNKPGYVSVFDSEFVAPEPNVKNLEPDSLVKSKMALLFQITSPSGGHLDWCWYTGEIQSASRVKKKSKRHLVASVKFPGDNGARNVDLNGGLKYNVDWVLLTEQPDGAMARKKQKKKKKKKEKGKGDESD